MLAYLTVFVALVVVAQAGHINNAKINKVYTVCATELNIVSPNMISAMQTKPEVTGCMLMRSGCVTATGVDTVKMEEFAGKLSEEQKQKITGCIAGVERTYTALGEALNKCRKEA